MSRRTSGRGLVGFGVIATSAVALFLAVACGGGTAATKEDRLCTPNNYVYCRCEDRSEGTKLCESDGLSFKPCVCTGESSGELPPPFEEWDGGLEPIDAGPIDPGAPVIDVACTDRLGVVAGAGEDAYVAAYKGNGVFAVSKGATRSVLETPTLTNVGPSLVATWASRNDQIVWSKMLAGTWSAPEIVGSAKTKRGTTSAPYEGGARLVYVDAMSNLRFGVYGATGWNDALGYAGTPSPDAGADGKGDPASAAPSDGSVLVAWTTQAGALVSRSLSAAGNWLVPRTLVQSGVFAGPVSLTAIEGSATEDALVVYAGDDLVLRGVARDITGGTTKWKAPIVVDNAALAIEHRLVGLPGGRALLAYLGSNDTPYVSIYTPGVGFSPPSEMLPGKNPVLVTAPVLTKGRCGSEATAVVIEKATGAVKVLRMVPSAWLGPYDVPGIPKATWAGVAETP